MEAADWASVSDQVLLERRISKLGLRLEGTPLEPLIRQLYDELSAHGLAFHPPCHIGDEWFVPFFLVHDRLRALELTWNTAAKTRWKRSFRNIPAPTENFRLRRG